MTEKELHKLGRQDLLQLLLVQSREVARQKSAVEEIKALLEKERGLTDRLKEKLDAKDETIEHLKARLNDKDEALKVLRERPSRLDAGAVRNRRNSRDRRRQYWQLTEVREEEAEIPEKETAVSEEIEIPENEAEEA